MQRWKDLLINVVMAKWHAQDNDNDTLVEDGSSICLTCGPAGMSDGVMTPKKHRKSGQVLSTVGSNKSQEAL